MVSTEKQNGPISKILPVMFGFFIMGFIDLIGIASNYVKQDFELSDSVVNLISLSCFLWFLVISIPTGMIMNKIGRKRTVLVSYLFTLLGLLIPCLSFSFECMMVAFALIGIGNAIIQVALNPLVTNVVSNERLTGTLTIGQFIKAVSSFVGPIAASWFAITFFEWKYVFLIYAFTTLLSGLWLCLTPITESKSKREEQASSFKATLSLLKNKTILFMFIGILVLVGVDVGVNMTLPKYFMEKCNVGLNDAVLGNSVYFFVRTLSAFLGGIILMKYSERLFFKFSVLISFFGLILLVFSDSVATIIACTVIFGIGYANLFSIIFSLALKIIPQKANEISSLLIVGVSGGAIITPILGFVSDMFFTQSAAIIVLILIWLYMMWMIKKVKNLR